MGVNHSPRSNCSILGSNRILTYEVGDLMTDYHRLHYNFVAKRLRNNYPTGDNQAARRVVEDIALEFAQRFAEDSVNFDPVKFLNACSPDANLGELWEVYLDSIDT